MTPTYVQVSNQSDAPGLDAVMAPIVHALGRQAGEHCAPFWSPVPAIGTLAQEGGFPFIFKTNADVAGVLGYHDEEGAYVFTAPTLSTGGSLILGADAVSVTASHELLELIGDPNTNRWCDAPDGYDYALELCDPVEGDAYEIDGVAVSNFVLPPYFDPNPAPGARFDFLGKLTAPFSMTRGGYLIRRVEGGQIDQIFAAHAERHGLESSLANIHMVGKSGERVVVVEFGPEYPEHRKAAKLQKAAQRRCAP